MFQAVFSPVIRSTWLYLQYLVVFTQVAAGWCRQYKLDVYESVHRDTTVKITNKMRYLD
jgi:hypothetical protein